MHAGFFLPCCESIGLLTRLNGNVAGGGNVCLYEWAALCISRWERSDVLPAVTNPTAVLSMLCEARSVNDWVLVNTEETELLPLSLALPFWMQISILEVLFFYNMFGWVAQWSEVCMSEIPLMRNEPLPWRYGMLCSKRFLSLLEFCGFHDANLCLGFVLITQAKLYSKWLLAWKLCRNAWCFLNKWSHFLRAQQTVDAHQSIFSIGSSKMFLFKSHKPWTKPVRYKVNCNIIYVDLEQKSTWKLDDRVKDCT